MEDEVIDLKSIKKAFTGKEMKSVKDFFAQNNFWLIPLLCIFIAMSFSVFMRIQPASLPITDQWAESTMHDHVRRQVEETVRQQYPNLPDENIKSEVEANMAKVLEEQKGSLDQQIQGLSQQFKSKLQDEDGRTYLLAIDPYYWLGLAQNHVDNGHLGDGLAEDGTSTYSLRDGRLDKPVAESLNPYAMSYLFSFMKIFNSNISLMGAAFYLPLIIITLTIIPIFFIGRKLGGNYGGFFAATILAVNSALLSRTPAGFADTDAYNVFFPALIAWMFFEALDADSKQKQIIYGSLAGLFTGLFAFSWKGWGFMFDFVLAAIGITALWYIYVFRNSIKSYFEKNQVKRLVMFAFTYLISAGIFVSLFEGFSVFSGALLKPLKFMQIKSVAVKTIWPNVMTTVAEFNVVDISNIMGQMGGKFLFFLAVLGAFATLLRKDKEGKIDFKYFVLLAIWFAGTTYAFTKGTRFAILMVPAFAISLGTAMGVIFQKLSEYGVKELKVQKVLSQVIVIFVLSLFLIAPIKSAYGVAINEIPSFTDEWKEVLDKIHDDADDGIITSWWDFGHWFVTMGQRRVTFDGGNQGKRIHWVGRSLVTDNEEEAVGILRMLNCGQEGAATKMQEFIGDDFTSIALLKEIILMNKEDANAALIEGGLTELQVTEILALTHCSDLIDNYVIASQDMVGKAGVWGHFGSWDFTKAAMYNRVKKLNVKDGMKVLTEDFGLDEDQADKYYFEIQNQDPDRWIAPWPGYMSGRSGCQEEDGELRCGNGLIVDLSTMEPYLQVQGGEKVQPKNFAYLNSDFEFVLEQKETNQPVGAILIPTGTGYDAVLMSPEQTGSMFTRMFYFEGHGLKYFDTFDDRSTFNNLQIITYKVDYEGTDKIAVDKFLPTPEVKASHILLRVEENATEQDIESTLAKINIIRNRVVNGESFSALAKEFSEDPSAAVNSGELGWFGSGRMVKPFEDAAFSMEVGDVSEPILTQFGYHILYLTGKRRGNDVNEIDVPVDVVELVEDSNVTEDSNATTENAIEENEN